MRAPATARSRRRRWVWSSLALTLVGVVAATAWVGLRALQAKDELQSVSALAGVARDAVVAGDATRLAGLVSEIDARAGRAASAASDPVWGAAEVVPGIGPNLRAVRVVAQQLAAVARELPATASAAAALTARPPGALVDPAALSKAAGPFARADDAVTAALKSLDELGDDPLVPPVAEGVDRLRTALAAVAPVTDAASRAAAALPAMLGLDGERTLLVMVQNPAELRTGGGITGTFAELRADGGVLTLVAQADSSAFPGLAAPIAPVPETTTALYGGGVGRFVQNASMTPYFAVTGALASAWWASYTGRTPDTVIAVDPYVLRAVLEATGPVSLASGASLDAGNVIDTLLVAPYLSLSPDQQSGFFSDAMSAVFTRLAVGDVDPVGLVQALQTPVAEGRVSVWSADAAEDAVLSAGPLGGPAARQAAAGPGAFAVYLNDATGAKMARFLDVSIDASVVGCRADDLAEVAVSVTMGSSAPADAATLPISVTGGGLSGVGAGDIGTNVTVSAPVGSFVGAVMVKDQPYPAATAIDAGRASSTARVDLSPAETSTLEFRFFVPRAQASALEVVHTPLINAPKVQVAPSACTPVSPSPPSR